MLLSEALSTVEVPRAILKIFMLLLTSVQFFYLEMFLSKTFVMSVTAPWHDSFLIIIQ